MSKTYHNLLVLARFLTRDLPLEKFIDEAFSDVENLEKKELYQLPEKSRKHEESHGKAWHKYGISFYYVIDNGKPATIPERQSILNYIKTTNIDKNEFIKLYLEVVTAPEHAGLTMGFSDNWMKRILNNEFKSTSDFALAYAAENCF